MPLALDVVLRRIRVLILELAVFLSTAFAAASPTPLNCQLHSALTPWYNANTGSVVQLVVGLAFLAALIRIQKNSDCRKRAFPHDGFEIGGLGAPSFARSDRDCFDSHSSKARADRSKAFVLFFGRAQKPPSNCYLRPCDRQLCLAYLEVG